MEVHIKIIGGLLVILSLIHLSFPQYFNWKKDLKHLSLINRQMMLIHTFFIALIIFLIGLLCLISSNELTQTKLGKTMSFGLGIFWSSRLIVQLFGYSTKLWKGKTFETFIHIIFTGLWLYISLIFWMNFLN